MPGGGVGAAATYELRAPKTVAVKAFILSMLFFRVYEYS